MEKEKLEMANKIRKATAELNEITKEARDMGLKVQLVAGWGDSSQVSVFVQDVREY
jgi:hypothetical protein